MNSIKEPYGLKRLLLTITKIKRRLYVKRINKITRFIPHQV